MSLNRFSAMEIVGEVGRRSDRQLLPLLGLTVGRQITMAPRRKLPGADVAGIGRMRRNNGMGSWTNSATSSAPAGCNHLPANNVDGLTGGRAGGLVSENLVA